MTCATCKAVLSGTARFCASCGAPRPDAPRDAVVAGVDVRGDSAPPTTSEPKAVVSVDPLGMTAPDAFAKTANADARAELERALASYDAKQKGGASPPAGPVHTQEMQQSAPSALSPSQVSPKAASHVVPKQQAPRTAAMPASAHMRAAAQPSPSIAAAQAGSPQARIPLAPGSSGGIAAIPTPGPSSPHGPPAAGGPRLSPVPMPQPIRPMPQLAPGLAVSVSWVNGQRYRGTIVQLMGGRVLVVFPDGQQHWVEMSYITPA